MRYGGIEAGGTKFICAVGEGPGAIRRQRIPTAGPEETLAAVIQWFRAHPIEALGVGCFGPIGLDPEAPDYGRVSTTPKPGWGGADIVGTLRRALGVPVAFDTDVNAAALGERRWGAARGLDTFVYLTVGTGIGGGGYARGRRLRGLIHPEMGHVRPPRLPGDTWPGSCPYHGDCLEGLASGPAIAARVGRPAEALPPRHPAWDAAAHALAHGLYGLICTLSPQRIIVGGGVAAHPGLLPAVRRELAGLLGGYFAHPALADLDRFVVPPELGADAGVLGALALAEEA